MAVDTATTLHIANAVGYVAAVVGTSIMAPQIVKMVRTERARDVSLAMANLYCVNCILWLTYGSLINARPVIVANAIGLAIDIVQVVLKQKYNKLEGGDCARN